LGSWRGPPSCRCGRGRRPRRGGRFSMRRRRGIGGLQGRPRCRCGRGRGARAHGARNGRLPWGPLRSWPRRGTGREGRTLRWARYHRAIGTGQPPATATTEPARPGNRTTTERTETDIRHYRPRLICSARTCD
jgi:hypothetical protein